MWPIYYCLQVDLININYFIAQFQYVCTPIIFLQVNAFGREIALIPVVAVLAVTGIKDAFEDYRRYKQDAKVNSSLCQVYDK